MGNTAQSKIAEQKNKALPQLLPANSRDSRLTQLLKPYLPQKEIKIIWNAYEYSLDAHKGQKRRSGEDYIIHPVSVACIAAHLHLDSPSIQAALLHDVVEDTSSTLIEIESKFGSQVASIVGGLSKLDKIHFDDASQAQAENFRKMLLAMSQDVRVILIKLADRLHNMETLEHLSPKKRIRISQETL